MCWLPLPVVQQRGRMGDDLPDSMFESFRYKGAGAKKAVPASGGARDSFGGGPSDDAWADVDLDSIQAQAASSSSRPAAAKPASRTVKLARQDGHAAAAAVDLTTGGSFASSPVDSPSPQVVRAGRRKAVIALDSSDEDDDDASPQTNKRPRLAGQSDSNTDDDDADLQKALRLSQDDASREERELQQALERSKTETAGPGEWRKKGAPPAPQRGALPPLARRATP